MRTDGRTMGGHDVTESAAAELLARFDADGDGTIDMEELLALGLRAKAIVESDVDGAPQAALAPARS